MNHPKNFFLQFGIIVTLYSSVISFLTFAFGIIDFLLPRAGAYYDFTNSGIRYSISVLIVMFPLFLWFSRIYRKAVANNQELKESSLRKWLLYLTLFLSGLTIAIDVIVLINAFLGGQDLVMSFLLKIFVVLLITVEVFYFYLKDIKGEWEENPKKAKLIALITEIVILGSVVLGIVLIGSPSKQRDFANDRQRVMNLESTQSEIVNFYQAKGRLPKTLEEMVDPLVGGVVFTDPETNEAYEYEVTGPLSFKICATFKTDSKETKQTDSMVDFPMIAGMEHFEHGVGEKCFERTIDKDRFPIMKPVPIVY